MSAPKRLRALVFGVLVAATLGGLARPATAEEEEEEEERTARVTQDTLERWGQELTPLIEAASGRKFVVRTRLALATRAQVAERAARLRTRASTADDDAPISLVDPSLASVLGIYLQGTQEVFFLTDNVEATFVDYAFAPELLHPVMKCIVAHELVHALQHQVAPVDERGDDEATRLTLSLREGHADFVAAQVCGAGNRFLDMAQGLDIPASRAAIDPHAFAYGYAESFIGALESVAGTEAVWAALVAPPPPRALVTRVGGAGLPSGWTDAAPLAAVARTFAPSPKTGATPTDTIAPMAPGPVLASLAAESEHATDVAALAGLGLVEDGDDAFVGVFAFLLRDEEAATAWIHRRRTAMQSDRVRVLSGEGLLASAPRAGAVRGVEAGDDGATLSVRAAFTSGDRYVEQWVARGHHLYGVVHRASKVNIKALTGGLAALLDLHLPDPPQDTVLDDADRAALLAMVPPAPVATGVSWQFRRDQLYPILLRQDWAACLDRLDGAQEGLDPSGRSALAVHAMPCALNGSDLGQADRLYDLIRAPDQLEPDVAANYAGHLAKARRWDEVLVVLDAAPGASDTAFVATTRLNASVNLRRWPDVERLLALGEAHPQTRAWAASQLAQAGRKETARVALRAACPALTEKERGICTRLLTQLGG
jgi:hypothetical protein